MAGSPLCEAHHLVLTARLHPGIKPPRNAMLLVTASALIALLVDRWVNGHWKLLDAAFLGICTFATMYLHLALLQWRRHLRYFQEGHFCYDCEIAFIPGDDRSAWSPRSPYVEALAIFTAWRKRPSHPTHGAA